MFVSYIIALALINLPPPQRSSRQIKNDSLRRKLCLSEFMHARANFDKSLRKKERNYNREKLLFLENLPNSNPREFWRKINCLGPTKKNSNQVPNIVKINNNITDDLNEVQNKWYTDFSSLYIGHIKTKLQKTFS